MRAAHSNLQRQNTVYSHKKYVILQHLLLMRLIVDTRWAKGAKRLCFTCCARETQALNSLGFLYEEILVYDIRLGNS